ncbi:cytochrome aa3 quinol oxidase subunit IV [Virgibacillus phasianinus]|uniref:Cytochrome aa3 quinol oxidase subunit IV n=1 Tax=Virgibacillus phasianinus TaxID=2017483 RepID=A0A220U6U1_9BACI|nr:cytochrome C oxidase subunit IV family protein [Virgibacillus phasianinus]ASK63837.1 cytochrome aa3 quinol oxidase subunit IV [Virgibacillus phasianinus]
MAEQSKKIPTQHIIGFALSVILTIIAAWTALGSDLSTTWIITGIMVLAVLQAAIQLFMFMHITEKGVGNAPWNMIFHGFVIVAIIVAGSLFTMSYGFGHDMNDMDNDNMDMEHMEHMEQDN